MRFVRFECQGKSFQQVPTLPPSAKFRAPPFARLPDPSLLFVRRAQRLAALAEGHQLGPYLRFLAALSHAQHDVQDGLPNPEVPDMDARERARTYGMPPLDRGKFMPEAAFETLERLIGAASAIEKPEAAAEALDRLKQAGMSERDGMMRNVLADAIPMETLAEHVYVAAALQVHFARLAARLDASTLVPVGDGACPVCGGPPVSSLIVGWHGAHGARFCACSLCGTLWNYVRIKCTLCGSTKGVGYQEIEGGPGTVKCGDLRFMPLLRQNPASAQGSGARSHSRRRGDAWP